MNLRLVSIEPRTPKTFASTNAGAPIGYRAERLFLAHRLAVYRYLLKLVRNEDDAQDLLQECYLRVVKGADTDEKLTPGYLFTIALNLARDRGRRATSRFEYLHESLENTELVDTQLTPDDELLWRQGTERIKEALNELPERKRKIFLLRRFRNLSAQDIANLFGISKRTVERELVAAMAHCRDRIKELL